MPINYDIAFCFFLLPTTKLLQLEVSYQPVHWRLPHLLLSWLVDSLVTQTVTRRVLKQLGNWNFTAKIQSISV